VSEKGEEEVLARTAEVGRMLSGLVRALKKRQRSHSPDT